MDFNDFRKIKTTAYTCYSSAYRISLTSKLVCSLLVLLAFTVQLSEGAPCQQGQWWDPGKDSCIVCSACPSHLIVLRPCQPHMDTVCGNVHELEVDWNLLARSQPRDSWKDEQKRRQQEQDELDKEHQMLWTWQAASLALAVIACLLFFIAAAVISINHILSWRRIEKHFDADIEELSAQLMARLATNMQSYDGNPIMLDDPIHNRNSRNNKPIEVHCVYLDKFLAEKDEMKSHHGRGNVYIQDNNKSKNKKTAGGELQQLQHHHQHRIHQDVDSHY